MAERTPEQAAQSATGAATQSQDDKTTSISPFFSVDGDDRFRPFFTNLEQHDANTATIILVQKNITPETPSVVTDYFQSFKTKVNNLLPDMQKNNGSVVDLSEVSGQEKTFYGVFRNFSLIRYAEDRNEIAKIALNFGGKFNVYFFGSQPRVYNFGGFFLDSKNYPYYEQFMRTYDEYLAGGKCVSNGFRLYLAYDNKITSGWMLRINTEGSSESPYTKTFSFQLLIDDENWFRVNYQYDVSGNRIEGNGMSNLHQISELAKR